MAVAVPSGEGPPAEINTTPLVDVMLVPLVMTMLSIPLASHSLDYDLPGGDGATVHEVRNRLTISANDRIFWNGAALSEAALATTLSRAAAMDPEPQLEFEPDPAAGYAASARVLRLVKASGATNFGFAGHERYRDFDRAR